MALLAWPFIFAFTMSVGITMIHYPYDTAAVKNAAENTIELLESAALSGLLLATWNEIRLSLHILIYYHR